MISSSFSVSETITPRLGTLTISPSASSARKASRTGVRNLTLRGDGSSSILITDGNDQVLFLSECSGIILENLTLGHRVTPDEGCSNGVLYMWGVDGLTVTNCDIFGCGIEGINASSCSDLWFENTTVRDCSEDIMG